MADTFNFGVPVDPDQLDGVVYTMGCEFRCNANGIATGCRWWVPSVIPGGNCQVLLYRKSDQALLASSGFFSPVVVSQYINTNFTATANLLAYDGTTATEYVAAVLTNRYAFTNGGWPFTSTPGSFMTAANGVNGRFSVTVANTPVFPATISGIASNYFIGPIVNFDTPVSGDLDAVLPGLTADLNGASETSGVLGATLPALLADIVGSVPVQAVLNATLPALTADLTGASAAGGATVGPCGWTIPDPLCCAAEWALVDPAVQSAARDYAALILWGVTGRQFGLCEITVRPCGMKKCADGSGEFWGYDWSGGTWVPYIFNGQWFNCACGMGCCCDPRCQVRLMGPVEEMVEVLIGGIAVDPATYRVDDEHWLVRTAGECWPQCADMDTDDGDNVFQVTYLRGSAVPAALLRAASTLACEWAKACTGSDTCRLSNRVTSIARSGITIDMVDPTALLDQGLTGLWEVDTVIKTLNPHQNVQRLRVYAPELNVPRMTTWP